MVQKALSDLPANWNIPSSPFVQGGFFWLFLMLLLMPVSRLHFTTFSPDTFSEIALHATAAAGPVRFAATALAHISAGLVRSRTFLTSLAQSR